MRAAPQPFRDLPAGTPARPLRVLVTGFEPFGGSPINPSAVLLELLESAGAPGCQLRTLLLPVVGGTGSGSARAALDAALDALQPDALVLFGEAHTRGAISIERVAVNLRDYRIADNSGDVVQDTPVVAGAPDALFAALPVRAMADAVEAADVPVELSLSAGAFLCNEVMFHALERRLRTGAPQQCGFIHLPQLPEQAALRPTHARPMPAQELLRGAQAALAALATPEARAAGGLSGAPSAHASGAPQPDARPTAAESGSSQPGKNADRPRA